MGGGRWEDGRQGEHAGAADLAGRPDLAPTGEGALHLHCTQLMAQAQAKQGSQPAFHTAGCAGARSRGYCTLAPCSAFGAGLAANDMRVGRLPCLPPILDRSLPPTFLAGSSLPVSGSTYTARRTHRDACATSDRERSSTEIGNGAALLSTTAQRGAASTACRRRVTAQCIHCSAVLESLRRR